MSFNNFNAQLWRVWNLMEDGEPRTLKAISAETGDPEASVSARLRDLRKPQFGKHTVQRFHLGHGVYDYKLTPRTT